MLSELDKFEIFCFSQSEITVLGFGIHSFAIIRVRGANCLQSLFFKERQEQFAPVALF